jgi:hypothetical protein
MAEDIKPYPRLDRRRHCQEDCPFADQARKSLPRVYFFASWSALIVCLIAFAGWHESSMEKLKMDIGQREMVHRRQVEERIADASRAYTQDVERFIRATGEIRKMIREVQVDIGQIKVQNAEIRTTQNMLVERTGLSD